MTTLQTHRAPARAEASPNALALLQQLNRDYVRAVERRDVGWFEENLGTDFLNVNADGTLVDRAGFVAQIARPLAISDLEPREVQVRIMGDFAIVNARTAYTTANGQPGSRRYTDAWARRQGRWLCVSAQLTSLPSGEPRSLPMAHPEHDDAMRQLKLLNARFIHNYVTNDVASHAAITHRNFVCMPLSGAREGRDAYLARWATGFDRERVVYWDYRDESIAVFGSAALVRATNKHTIRKDGAETTGMTAYTDSYVHEDGEWKCIQAQFTPVLPQHYPGDETIVRRYIKGELQAD